MTLALLLAPMIAAPPAAPDPKAPPPPEWAPHTLVVGRPLPADGIPARPGVVNPRNLDAGTRVTVILRLTGRAIVGFEPAQSKLEGFTDDKGTDLLAATEDGQFPRPRVTAELAEGHYGLVSFRGPGIPAAGATRVRIRGTVVALVGKGEKEVEVRGRLSRRASLWTGPAPSSLTLLSVLSSPAAS